MEPDTPSGSAASGSPSATETFSAWTTCPKMSEGRSSGSLNMGRSRKVQHAVCKIKRHRVSDPGGGNHGGTLPLKPQGFPACGQDVRPTQLISTTRLH